MLGSGSQTRLEGPDYDAIEAAVSETERGRRFLAEFARRHRGADTDMLLQAIRRLETTVTRDAVALRGPGDLAGMAETIARARAEIAAADRPEAAGPRPADAFGAIVRDIEGATCEILGSAEAMQEAAWSLRETGADTGLCDVLDRRAIAIYTACSLQDAAAHATGRVVDTLRDLEARIAALMAGQGAPAGQPPVSGLAGAVTPPPGPAAADELDFVPAPVPAHAPPIEPHAPAADTAAEPDDLASAFADLDRLSIEEKIALFS